MSEKMLRFTRSCAISSALVGAALLLGTSRGAVTFGGPLLMAGVCTLAIEVLVDLMFSNEADHERDD